MLSAASAKEMCSRLVTQLKCPINADFFVRSGLYKSKSNDTAIHFQLPYVFVQIIFLNSELNFFHNNSERIAIFNSLLVELIKLAYTVAQAGSKSVRDSGSVELFVARARVVDHRNLIHCISLVEVVNAFKHGTIRCLWKTQ